MVRKSVALVFFLLNCLFVFAQKPAEVFKQMNQKYPKELGVYLKKNTHVKIDWVKDSLHIVADTEDELMFLSDLANSLSKQSVSYSHFNIVEKLEAYTLTPENGKYNKIPVNKFETNDVVDESIFYNDVKEIEFNFPGLRAGAVAVVKYKEKYPDPFILNGHYFSAGVPVENSTFSVTYPKFIEMGFFKHGDSSVIKTTYSETKTHKTVSFTVKEYKRPKNVESAPSPRHYIPHVNFCVKQVTVNGKSKKYLGSVEDLYRWDYSHLSKANLNPDTQVVRIAKSLMKPKMTNLDKAKTIFSWVQENIKYIAFENGYEGFVPRNAGDVCRRKYGDCKDMSSILVEMMKAVGLNAYMVLIGTDELPYKYEDNPLPSSANHMIACVKDNGKYYFLDATGRFYPAFFPTQFIQGKEALISISKDSFEVVTVPTPTFKESVIVDSVYLEISDRKIIGKGKTFLTGYRKIDFHSRYNNTLPENMKEMLNDYLHLGNNKFLQNNHKTQNLSNQSASSQITYDFTIDDYVVTFKEGLAVNLFLIKKWKGLEVEKDRKQPLMFNYPSESKLHATLKIPDGFKIGYLPKNKEFENENFGFGIKYKAEKDRVITEQTYRIKHRYVTPQMFNEWNKMLSELKASYKEVVMLEKNDSMVNKKSATSQKSVK